jgi:chaperonin GroES
VLKPHGSRLLVKRWPQVDEHESGLILPAEARELPQIGRVIAIGNGWWNRKLKIREPLDVAVGDDVVFEKFVKTDYRIFDDGVEYLLLPYETLYFVIVGGISGIEI